MNANRRYNVLPDHAVCHHPGCSWRCMGEPAETLGEAHAINTGHEVRVKTAAVVTFRTGCTAPEPVR